MKKALSFLCLTVFLVMAVSVPGSAAFKLSIKLNGGAAMLFNGAGDLEKYRQGEEAWAKDWGEEAYSSAAFNWKKLSVMPEFGGEIIFHFNPHFGFGIGSGYINASSQGDYTLSYNESGTLWWGTWTETETDKISHDYRVKAIPIIFNFHFFTPLTPSLNFFAHAGVGYYMGKMTHAYNETLNYSYGYESWYYWNQKQTIDGTWKIDESAKCNKLGFNGGAGLEMLLTPAISIGLELFGRMVNFNNWEGDWDYSASIRERYWHEVLGWWYDVTSTYNDEEHGNLWYWDWHSNYYNKDYATLGIREEKPESSSVKNARKAGINLNRFGAVVTIRFHFDL